MRLVQVSYTYDHDCHDPEELLERYSTLTGWGEAILGAGAAAVTTVQRFGSDHRIWRAGVEHRFVADGGTPHPRLVTPAGRTNRTVAQFAPDLVHVHGLIYPLQTFQLRMLIPWRAAIVVQDHGGADPAAFSAPRRLVSKVLRCADAFSFSAVLQAEPWRAAGILSASDRILEVMEASTKLRRVALPTPVLPGNPAILWVGRLIPEKDPLTVLDGFRRALPAIPGAHITFIYREDPLGAAMRGVVAKSPELVERVHLLGAVPHARIAEYYSSAHIFVLGSRREGSGYALIEALACGVVPIVTSIPSFRALTADGRLGELFPPGDAQALSEAFVRAAGSDLSSQRGQILADFESRLRWKALAVRALEYYREVQCLRRQRILGLGGAS